MKRLKMILKAKKQKIIIHDPIEALVARMCDPEDPMYDQTVAEAQDKNDYK